MSLEKLILREIDQDHHKLFDINLQIQNVFSDFEGLDFSSEPKNYTSDDINYNEGNEANPFDKIAKYYGRKKNVFLFISMLRNEEQLKKIMDIVSKKCDVQAKEMFIERLNIYLDRINKGEYDANEFLNGEFPGAFLNGPHTGTKRNIHQNLNITIKPGETLETSILFDKKGELEREKIYNEKGERIMTVEKNSKQRKYLFTKHAIYDIEISWNANDESGKNVNCSVVLHINCGQVSVKKSTIGANNSELKEILELAKQNKAVIIKNQALYEVLEASMMQN